MSSRDDVHCFLEIMDPKEAVEAEEKAPDAGLCVGLSVLSLFVGTA